MRVIVNRLVALGRKTGIGHYTTQLLRCLHEQAAEGEIEEFPQGWLRRAQEAYRGSSPQRQGGRPTARCRDGSPLAGLRDAARGCLRQGGRALLTACLRSACSARPIDLYHEPNYLPLPVDCPTVATICDLSVLRHPEWHPADRVAHFERHFRRGVAACAHLLAISETGRREIIDTLQVPPEKVTCTYMGIRPGLGPVAPAEVAHTSSRLGLPPRYLLYLGTIEPRKNLLVLLRAYCALPAALRQRWPLLLVGGWGWNTADVAEYLHTEARHRGVIHLGYAAEEHMAALYSGARALVYPSLYEGFGLPPVEMMACGGAVLASTAGAVAEVVGGQAHLVAPQDVDGWRSALERVVTDDEWWQSLRRGAREVARPYTWDRCAAETLAVYRSLCGVAPAETRRAA